jgi:N-acetylglucosaminyldiphosphoundecaprenol N-acetyl-beta-D-mannosaminyltransferase
MKSVYSQSQSTDTQKELDAGVPVVRIESLMIHNFKNYDAFFRQFTMLCKARTQKNLLPALSMTYNVFSANLAYADPDYQLALQQSDILRCDGVGALLGSRIIGQPISTRLTNAFYFPQMLSQLAREGLTVFLLGGQPGVAEVAIQKLSALAPNHTIVGCHHGYLSQNQAENEAAIAAINVVKPDVVVVGMGMPVQELWMVNNRERLNCGMLFAVGALIDYYGGAQYRCPEIFQKLGLEWLTRLVRYPVRMFSRYMIGNPYYLWRMCCLAIQKS